MNILKLLRERNKFTQEFVANKLGVTRQSYIRYETGEVELTASAIRVLANLYQIEYRNIIDGIMPEDTVVYMSRRNHDVEKFRQIVLYTLQAAGDLVYLTQTDFYKLIYLIHKDFYEQYLVQLTSLYYPEQSLTEGLSIYANEISKMAEENLIEFINTSIHKGQAKKIIPLTRSNLNYLTGTEVCFLHREFARYSTEF
ncbi:MAG: helix-turn-helix transcriptional regulator [Treponema sp.]|nr:helix-turn-helix transcriptional regulator [Treponema sp.]